MLTNANRIINKLDELFLIYSTDSDVMCITESWLSPQVPDSAVRMPDFVLHRRDRTDGIGGGVMCYVRSSIYSKAVQPDVSAVNDFEVLWVLTRPKCLPRPLSVIIFVVVYAPPWYDVSTRRELSNYIMAGIYFFSSKFTNAGFFVVGDYNQLDTTFLEKRLRFKQLVKNNTRREKILDKIFTNLFSYYGDAAVLPPLGKSDHNCVVIRPESVR